MVTAIKERKVSDKSIKSTSTFANVKGDLSPAIKWAGGKYSSGVCEYLGPLYHRLKDKFPLYVAGFGGALGDVFYLNPERYIAIDTVPEVVNFYNWVKEGGTSYLPPEGKAKYDLIRRRFNHMNLAYQPIANLDPVDIDIEQLHENARIVIDNLDVDKELYDEFNSLLERFDSWEFHELLKTEELLVYNPEEFDLDNLDDGLETLQKIKVEAERQINSLFYWLNKNGYNGMWRVNSKGEFNVPINDKTSETTITQSLISQYTGFLQKGEYYRDDFRTLPLYLPEGHHFVYLDPPYHKTFGGYSKGKFSIEDQISLATMAEQLVNAGHFVVASNSDNSEMIQLYEDHGFSIRKVYAKRRLSCKGKKRQPVLEMFAYACKNPTDEIVQAIDSLPWI